MSSFTSKPSPVFAYRSYMCSCATPSCSFRMLRYSQSVGRPPCTASIRLSYTLSSISSGYSAAYIVA